eukprot:GCRY01001867.1.p1 GENE.GCRY01001867.1~~GCRY01001867.1.p1  ORF type:complete len:173 (+),score=1.68 GCRY01001867.1:74-520(+)
MNGSNQQPARLPVAARTTTNIIRNPTEKSIEVNDLISHRKLKDLVAQVDGRAELGPEVEKILLEIADDFIENVASFSCRLAAHRNSNTVEARDVLLHLERSWDILLPGFHKDEPGSSRKPQISEDHRTRLLAVKRAHLSQTKTGQFNS